MYPTPRTTQVPVKPLALAYREPTIGVQTETPKTVVAVSDKKQMKQHSPKWRNPMVVNDAYAAHWGHVVKELVKLDRTVVVKLAARHGKMCQKLSNATQAQLITYIEKQYSVNELMSGFMALGVAAPSVAMSKLPTGKCRLTVTLASGFALHVILCKFNFKQGTWILFTEVVLTNSEQEEVYSVLRINCNAPKALQLKLMYSAIDIEDSFKKIKSTETTANYLGMWLYRIHTLPKSEYWVPLGQFIT